MRHLESVNMALGSAGFRYYAHLFQWHYLMIVPCRIIRDLFPMHAVILISHDNYTKTECL